MRIIITGGSGFVGKPTIKALEEKGYEVFNYDLTEGYDIRNYYQFLSVLKPGDKILHLAAIARFADADADPVLAFETNTIGTNNIVAAAAKIGAERIVYSSTGSVYMPIKKDPPITEDFPTIGNSVYGCSKNLGELYIKAGITPHIILRYAHLYGEGKLKHGAIGGFIDRMNRGLAPKLYGGKQSNDITYIKDIVQANVLALESPAINGEYNIGSGEELTVEQVFDILQDFYNYKTEYERIEQRTVDPDRFVYDISKAEKELGYKPEFNFLKGMGDWNERQ